MFRNKSSSVEKTLNFERHPPDNNFAIACYILLESMEQRETVSGASHDKTIVTFHNPQSYTELIKTEHQ